MIVSPSAGAWLVHNLIVRFPDDNGCHRDAEMVVCTESGSVSIDEEASAKAYLWRCDSAGANCE
jgi:hypothetical protein